MVSARIVRMFEYYAQNINPDDSDFQTFIAQYLKSKGVKDPKAMQYSELYKAITEGIRKYLERMERAREQEKNLDRSVAE